MLRLKKRVVTWAERLSTLSVRPLTGVPLLLIVLYFGLYKFVGEFGAGTVVDLLEKQLFEAIFNPWITAVVKGIIPWGIIQELFVGEYGIITLGIRYAVGIILPIVATFFIFFSFLEDTGYFPRLALLVDRLFKLEVGERPHREASLGLLVVVATEAILDEDRGHIAPERGWIAGSRERCEDRDRQR